MTQAGSRRERNMSFEASGNRRIPKLRPFMRGVIWDLKRRGFLRQAET